MVLIEMFILTIEDKLKKLRKSYLNIFTYIDVY